MGNRHCMDYLLREHEELLKIADKIEKLLERAGKKDFPEHPKSLAELRALEHSLADVAEHCHATERLVESAYYNDLPPRDLARIAADHLVILKAVASFREELKCATADRTMAMILPGMDVVKLVRAHVAFEGEVFHRIAGLGESHGGGSSGKSRTKRTVQKKRRHAAKRPAPKEPASDVPYTLEPHPEF